MREYTTTTTNRETLPGGVRRTTYKTTTHTTERGEGRGLSNFLIVFWYRRSRRKKSSAQIPLISTLFLRIFAYFPQILRAKLSEIARTFLLRSVRKLSKAMDYWQIFRKLGVWESRFFLYFGLAGSYKEFISAEYNFFKLCVGWRRWNLALILYYELFVNTSWEAQS